MFKPIWKIIKELSTKMKTHRIMKESVPLRRSIDRIYERRKDARD